MAAITDIAVDGPVVGSNETEIDAPVEVVWDVLTAIDAWPSWNPDVKSASLDGGIGEGSRFRWKAGPGTVSSTIQRVERPGLIAWSGKTFGIRARHVWRLEARDGGTFVHTEESYTGLVARVFHSSLQKTLDHALDSVLVHLKAEAEKRAAA